MRYELQVDWAALAVWLVGIGVALWWMARALDRRMARLSGRFRSPMLLGLSLAAFLVFSIVLQIIAGAMIWQVAQQPPWARGPLLANLLKASLVAQAMATVAGVLLPWWTFRAYSNLPALGAQPRFAGRWPVLGYLVPPWSLVRPVQILAELWQPARPTERGWARAVVAAWWGLNLGTLGLTVASVARWIPPHWQGVSTAALVLVPLATSAATLFLVMRITNAQQRLGEARSQVAAVFD